MTARLPDKLSLPWLWKSFAAAWLLLLVLVAWCLPTSGLSPGGLGGSLAGLGFFVLLFLGCAARAPPGIAGRAAEIAHARPEPATIGALAVMAACVFAFTTLAPGLEI